MKDIKILHQFDENNTIHIIAESTSEGSCCPRCGTLLKSKHSKYTRKLSDGSSDGFSKNITIIVRKFKCKFSSCSQKIFTERLHFAAAITESLPNALQVSDKFYLVKNLLDNINIYIKRKYHKNLVIPKNKEEIVDAVIENKKNLKATISDEKIKAKLAFIKEIKDKHQSRSSIRRMAREYSMSKNTINEYLRSEKSIYWPQGIKRGIELDKYKSCIIKLLKHCKTHKEILHEISKLGYKGSLSYLSSYMSKNGIKRASVIDIADSSVNTKTNYIINSSLVIKAICKNSENLSNTDTDTLRMLSRTYPELIDLKNLIDDFKSIFKGGSLTLETWISKAKDFNVSE